MHRLFLKALDQFIWRHYARANAHKVYDKKNFYIFVNDLSQRKSECSPKALNEKAVVCDSVISQSLLKT